MTPVSKNDTLIYVPQGFLDGTSAPVFFTKNEIEDAIQKKRSVVLFSMRKVVYFNKNGIAYLVEAMGKIKEANHCVIGFSDLNTPSYRLMMQYYANEETDFCIFDDLQTANLFGGISSIEQGSQILFYAEDKPQRNSLGMELRRRGFVPEGVATADEYETARKEVPEKYAHSFKQTVLGSYDKRVASHILGNVVVYSADGYVDNDFGERFNLELHKQSLNVGFKLFVFDAESVISFNIHGVRFVSKLAKISAEYGATLFIAGREMWGDLKNQLVEAGVYFYESLEKLLADKELVDRCTGGEVVAKNNKTMITKNLVSRLPLFIDSTIYTLNILANAEAVKRSVDVRPLTIEENTSQLVASAVAFYGNLEGMLVLVFSKALARKACVLLLGEPESGAEYGDEEIGDALAELVNIIGGRTKMVLSEQKIHIDMTLPRSFVDMDKLMHGVHARKGVQVVLSFNDEPFYFFLTR